MFRSDTQSMTSKNFYRYNVYTCLYTVSRLCTKSLCAARNLKEWNLFLKLLRILTPLVIPIVAYLSERLPVSGKGELSRGLIICDNFLFESFKRLVSQPSELKKSGPELIFTEKCSAHASKWGCWSMPDSVDSVIFLFYWNFIFAATKGLCKDV